MRDPMSQSVMTASSLAMAQRVLAEVGGER